jgi:pimeloyl-ACP methyl ester carboxylesterase
VIVLPAGCHTIRAAKLPILGVMQPTSPRLITTNGPSGDLVSHVFSSGFGNDGATVYVLLHGIGMSHRYLARLQNQLSRGGVVHAIDLPGFGATPRPRHPLSVEEFATVINGVLGQLGVTSCVVVGHSMGVQFAVEAARQEPSRYSGVVLMSPVVDPRRRTVWQQALGLARDCLLEPPSANLLVLGDYMRCGIPWYLQTLQSMMRYPTERRVTAVTAPVLVLRGGSDPVAGEEWCRMLARNAGDGELLQLPRHRHVVQMSAPRSVAAAITRFAAGTP